MFRYCSPFALLVLGFICLASGLAQDGKKDTRAVLQEIDLENGTITVILTEAGKSRADRLRTFNLLKADIPVTDAQDKPKKLSDLQSDDRILLKVMDDDVVAIRLAPPVINGTVFKVDAKEKALVVRTKIGDKAVVVPAAAKVYNQNALARFEDLKLGELVVVAFAPDQKTVLEVRTGKTVIPLPKLTKGTGMLIEVDRDRHAVQIVANYSSGDFSLMREILVSREASFGLFYKAKPFREIPFTELGRGVKAYFWIDANTRKLAHIEVEMPTLGRRVIKSIDRERRQITLEEADGDRVLTLAPQLVVRTSKGVGKLDDLQATMEVSCGLSADRKRAEIVTILGK